MTETSNTNTTQAGVVAHALRALADHIDYRSVAAPRAVHVNDDHLRVNVPSAGDLAERWAVSLNEGDGIRCITVEDGYAHYETRGLLPDTGVRVRLAWARPATVEAVPA